MRPGFVAAVIALAFSGAKTSSARAVPLAIQQGEPAQLDTTYRCIACYADKRTAFVQGVHAERGIRCEDCHGGDPAAFTLPAAHRGRFTGAPGQSRQGGP